MVRAVTRGSRRPSCRIRDRANRPRRRHDRSACSQTCRRRYRGHGPHHPASRRGHAPSPRTCMAAGLPVSGPSQNARSSSSAPQHLGSGSLRLRPALSAARARTMQAVGWGRSRQGFKRPARRRLIPFDKRGVGAVLREGRSTRSARPRSPDAVPSHVPRPRDRCFARRVGIRSQAGVGVDKVQPEEFLRGAMQGWTLAGPAGSRTPIWRDEEADGGNPAQPDLSCQRIRMAQHLGPACSFERGAGASVRTRTPPSRTVISRSERQSSALSLTDDGDLDLPSPHP